jgi:DNA-binding IclR family transcriptional regulator
MKQKGALTAKEISDGVREPIGTVMTHLVTLADEGWIERIHEFYRLTMKMAVGWARKKSQLETDIEQKQKELESITL